MDPATAYVDIDQLGMSYCDEAIDPGAHRLKADALRVVAAQFARHGARTLVVSGVVGADLMALYDESLRAFDPLFIRLTAPVAALQRRLEARGGYAEDWAGVADYAQQLDALDLGHPIIDTTTGTVSQVADAVLAAVNSLRDAPATQPPPVDGPGAGTPGVAGRALLLGGTTAVGKSTIGWQVFMAAGGPDERCAFVDLRQLGFVGVDGGTVDHRLQARNLGALWQVFRAHGANRLIVNGPVSRWADLQTYQAAITPTPLIPVRLIADPAALRDRVNARLRGEMAPLAGDLLIGRPASEAEALTAVAVRAQTVDVDPRFPTLDTTALEPAAVAQDLLRHLPT
ncbi:MAG: hypothetical protein KDB63_13360 [Nocardioidaceae bacterium]|nr:hypothetical protein [Nocardioidaceae bacterium]